MSRRDLLAPASVGSDVYRCRGQARGHQAPPHPQARQAIQFLTVSGLRPGSLGQAQNQLRHSDACVCGTAVCDASSGAYCHKASNSCSVGPPCENTDGTAANAAACFCSSTADCAAGTGAYCHQAFGRCSALPACSNTAGTAANAAACACGRTADCGPDLGLFCYKDSNFCDDSAGMTRGSSLAPPLA